MRRLALALALLVGWLSPAGATSTINPTQPAAGAAYSSTPSRNNFQAAYNDINALQNCNKGTSPPSAPNGGYCWINSSVPTAWIYSLYDSTLSTWTPIGQLNTVTGVWTPLGGNSPIQSVVANNSALSARASTAFPNGVTRLGFASAGDGPIITYFASSSACSLNSGAGDGGSQIPTADGKCWIGVPDPSHLDVRIWGAQTTLADNGPAIQAAINYANANGGAVYIPGAPANARYTITSTQADVNPWGACLTYGAGTRIVGDRIGGIGSAAAPNNNSIIYCAADADGLAPATTARFNNQNFANFEIDGHAPFADATNTAQTQGIVGAFGSTGETMQNVLAKDFVIGMTPANAGDFFVGVLDTQQDQYPQPPGGNGYPLYGLAYFFGHGQLQAANISGNFYVGQQLSYAFTFTGDGVTRIFPLTIQTTEGRSLYRSDGINVTVSNITNLQGVDFDLTDATPGAPSTTIYGTTVQTTTTQATQNFTVSSASGLPSSITCTGTGSYDGCTPLVFMTAPGLPVGSFIHTISGTSGTFDNPDHRSAVVGYVQPVTFAEGSVAQQPGCTTSRAGPAFVSDCGGTVDLVFNTAPALNAPIVALWSDPWGQAAISLKAGSASDNIFEVGISSANVGIEDVSNGNNKWDVSYVQITNVCADLEAIGTSMRFPRSSPATVPLCAQSFFGPLTGTDKFLLNAQPGSNGHTFTTAAPVNLLMCSDWGTCPFTMWTVAGNFPTAAIGTTPVLISDGWWGLGNATNTMQTQTQAGLFPGSVLAMQVQRSAGSTDTTPLTIGQTVRSIRAQTLAGNSSSLACWLSPSAHFSASNDAVHLKVIGGTVPDEGTTSLLANLWTGQSTILDVIQNLNIPLFGGRLNYSFLPPANMKEIAVEISWTPTGTAPADDYLIVDGCQLEAAFLASPFQFHLPEEEQRQAGGEYEQSYGYHGIPGTHTSNGQVVTSIQTASSQAFDNNVRFRFPKNCTSPGITFYSPATGTVGNANVSGGVGDEPVTTNGISLDGFVWYNSPNFGSAAGTYMATQFTAQCPGLF